METEFKQWMQKEVKPRELKIGDKVRVTPSGSYGYTGPGSEGRILEFNTGSISDYASIEWYKITGGSPHSAPCIFDVHRRDIELI